MKTAIFKRLSLSIVLPLIAVLTACASTEKPNGLLAEAELSLDQARQVDAPRFAPAIYDSAEEYLMLAKQSIENEEYESAQMDLEKSMADSRYAIVKATSVKNQKAADQITEDLRVLKQETQVRNF